MSTDILWAVALLALGCEYVDSSLGMGYGTTLTPLLLFLGFTPVQVVPSVLLSEFLAGVLAALLHHRLGNVDLAPGSRSLKVVSLLAACSVVGALAAAFIAVSLPSWIIKAYIGCLVLGIGIGLLIAGEKKATFSWNRMAGLGLVAAINKGLSGGGYGPLLTGGQVLTGIEEKEAIGITSLAEGLTCLVGVSVYAIRGQGIIDWNLAPTLVLGALLSVPLSAITVKRLPVSKMRWMIGCVVAGIGAFTLTRLIV